MNWEKQNQRPGHVNGCKGITPDAPGTMWLLRRRRCPPEQHPQRRRIVGLTRQPITTGVSMNRLPCYNSNLSRSELAAFGGLALAAAVLVVSAVSASVEFASAHD